MPALPLGHCRSRSRCDQCHLKLRWAKDSAWSASSRTVEINGPALQSLISSHIARRVPCMVFIHISSEFTVGPDCKTDRTTVIIGKQIMTAFLYARGVRDDGAVWRIGRNKSDDSDEGTLSTATYPISHTTGLKALHVPCVVVTETRTTPAGKLSPKITLRASDGPLLWTSSVYSTFVPAMTGPGGMVFLTSRSDRSITTARALSCSRWLKLDHSFVQRRKLGWR